jgi:hypothetical protein
MEFYRQEYEGQAKAIPKGPTVMSFRWKNGSLHNWGMTFGEGDGTGLPTLLE